VPWRRLLKEYVIYAAIMGVILLVLFRDRGVVALLAGLVTAGPLYLLLGYVLAKFGYQRKTLADLRTPRASASTAPVSTAASGDGFDRPRPAPTRRTAAGPNRRPSNQRKRRR